MGARPRNLYRVLLALAGLGIFSEGDDGRFQLTPIAETLRSDVPGSVRSWAVLQGEELSWRLGGSFFTMLKLGEQPSAMPSTWDSGITST